MIWCIIKPTKITIEIRVIHLSKTPPYCFLPVSNFGGFYNAPNHANSAAFAALKADGSIVAWGDAGHGGTGAPSGNGYTNIYSTSAKAYPFG
jgi:hypothetical protein